MPTHPPAPVWPVQPGSVVQGFIFSPAVDYGAPPGGWTPSAHGLSMNGTAAPIPGAPPPGTVEAGPQSIPPSVEPSEEPHQDGAADTPRREAQDELQTPRNAAQGSGSSLHSLKRKAEPDGYTKVIWERLHKYTDARIVELRQQWETEWAGKLMPPPPPGIFATKDEAVESARDFAKKNGYQLVISHTFNGNEGNVSRLALICKYAGRYKNPKQVAPELRQRQRFSRKTDCPMKMRISMRTHASGWVTYVTNPKHNHAPEPSGANLPPAEHPDVEAALYEWHIGELAKGESPHGNSIKSKALTLFAELSQNKDPPNLDRQWLDHYRMRHDLLSNKVIRQSGPPELVDWDDADAVAAVTASINPPRSRETIAFAGVDSVFDDDKLITAMKTSVREFMSRYDGSHDWDHILRVLSLTKKILRKEMQPGGPLACDARTTYLAAICHDLGDHKYVKPGEDVENQIAEMLLQHGAPAELALKVQLIAKNVSYSNEVKNPLMMKAVLDQHPELAIVQDADRIDAIGAIGIGRTFLFTGAKRPNASMTETIDHFKEKLERLESMMKTDTGREIARERTQRLRLFRSWWDEEYELTE